MTTTEVMRYTFHVNSAQRSQGSNTDFTVNFSQVLGLLSKGGQFQVTVSNVQIPFTFYQLSATSNLNRLPVYLKNAVDVAGRNTTITLTPGNYTPYTLITELTNQLTTACTQVGIPGFTPFTPTFSITYTPTNGHMTFGLTAPAGSQINLLFSSTDITQLLGSFFGTLTDINMSPTASPVPSSTQPCVLNPVNYLLIRSNLKQFRNREFITQQDDVSDILYKIPITTAQGTWISYYQESEPVYILDTMIPSINFYLTNNLTYDPMNLQGIPWSFSFTIKEVVRPTYESIITTQIQNILPLTNEEKEKRSKIEELQRQKDDLLKRLDVYRKRISRRPRAGEGLKRNLESSPS